MSLAQNFMWFYVVLILMGIAQKPTLTYKTACHSLPLFPDPPLFSLGSLLSEGMEYAEVHTFFCDGHAKLFRIIQPYYLWVICFKILNF